jgi:hypothetical protein
MNHPMSEPAIANQLESKASLFSNKYRAVSSASNCVGLYTLPLTSSKKCCQWSPVVSAIATFFNPVLGSGSARAMQLGL